jgi:hypothetical protein
MNQTPEIAQAVPGLYKIIPLQVLRRMKGTLFDLVPIGALPTIDSIDRVIHEDGATSPAPVGDVQRPWYMHPSQEDHLLVLHGKRTVELYSLDHGRVETFVVTASDVSHNGKVVCDSPALLCWPTNVFHRVESDAKVGSASLNLAVHREGFDIRTNFSVYDLDVATGEYQVIRQGHEDQPESS